MHCSDRVKHRTKDTMALACEQSVPTLNDKECSVYCRSQRHPRLQPRLCKCLLGMRWSNRLECKQRQTRKILPPTFIGILLYVIRHLLKLNRTVILLAAFLHEQ